MARHFDRKGVNEEESPDIEYTSKNVEDFLGYLEGQLREVSDLRDKALDLDERLGIEAHALLSSVYRYYDRAADSAREWIGKNDGYAVRMIAYACQRSHKISYPALEILGFKLMAQSQFKGKSKFGVPLSPVAQRVYEIILTHQPIKGKAIIAKLDEESEEDINSLTESELRGRIMQKELKPLRDIENKGGAGYYDPHSYDPKKDARK